MQKEYINTLKHVSTKEEKGEFFKYKISKKDQSHTRFLSDEVYNSTFAIVTIETVGCGKITNIKLCTFLGDISSQCKDAYVGMVLIKT